MNIKGVRIIVISVLITIVFFGIGKIIFSKNGNTMESEKKQVESPENINLPPPSFSGEMSVEESLKLRRSVRSYSDRSLSLEDVSQVLWSAYGVSDSESFRIKLRTAPSAGATYPLELYLMVGNVEGLSPGIYKYHPESHSLSLHIAGDLRKEVAEACLGQKMLHEAPATIIYKVVYSRITPRYGQRGSDRYVCMDIGHSAQNVYLQTTAMGMATCAIGAFDDDKLTRIIKPQGEEEVLYLMPFGYPN